MKAKFYRLDPFPGVFGLALGYPMLKATYNRMGVPGHEWIPSTSRSAATTHYLESEEHKYCALVYVPEVPLDLKTEPWNMAGLLAHEASHVVQGIFERVNEEKPGEECRAYLMQQVTQFLMEDLFMLVDKMNPPAPPPEPTPEPPSE